MTLEIRSARGRFGEFTLGPIELTVESGVTAVLGPSGSGKSSLLSLIAGFETLTAGAITVDGARIDGLPPEDRSVGMVFQNHALFPHLSVRENLTFGADSEAAIGSTARLLEIEDLLDRDPGTLSGGEAQRVGLARALVSDPAVLLLDEPLSSLDRPIRRRLQHELRDVLADLSIPVIYVTHDQTEAAILGDRLAVLRGGELVREGATEAVFERPKSAFVAEFLGFENVLPASVESTTGSRTVLSVGEETIEARGRPPKAPVAVAVHPEAIELGRSGEANTLSVTVRRVRTRHSDATVRLNWSGPTPLFARVDRRRARALEPGETVTASIDPAEVHLTTRDR